MKDNSEAYTDKAGLTDEKYNLDFIEPTDVAKIINNYFQITTLKRSKKSFNRMFKAMFVHICSSHLSDRYNADDIRICLNQKSRTCYYHYQEVHKNLLVKKYYHASLLRVMKSLVYLNSKRIEYNDRKIYENASRAVAD